MSDTDATVADQLLLAQEKRTTLREWCSQATSGAALVRLARSVLIEDTNLFRVLRFTKVIDTALVNTPEGSPESPHISRGVFWWEGCDEVYGEHPGLGTLETPEGRRRFLSLLVAVCAAVPGDVAGTTLARSVIVGLRALFVVAAGSARVELLGQPLGQLVSDVIERTLPVDRARLLWERWSGESGSECDSSFSRFRRREARPIEPWAPERLAAFAVAAQGKAAVPQSSTEIVLKIFDRAGLQMPAGAEIDAGEIQLRGVDVPNRVWISDIETAARTLCERQGREPVQVIAFLERVFFERFLYDPARGGTPADDDPGAIIAFGSKTGSGYDRAASDVLRDVRFSFSWKLIPGVGELDAGCDIAWNTVREFVELASATPAEEVPSATRCLLHLIRLQWPTWTRRFDPEECGAADLKPLVAAVRAGDCERATTLALGLAGLSPRSGGRVVPVASAESDAESKPHARPVH